MIHEQHIKPAFRPSAILLLARLFRWNRHHELSPKTTSGAPWFFPSNGRFLKDLNDHCFVALVDLTCQVRQVPWKFDLRAHGTRGSTSLRAALVCSPHWSMAAPIYCWCPMISFGRCGVQTDPDGPSTWSVLSVGHHADGPYRWVQQKVCEMNRWAINTQQNMAMGQY